MIKCKCWIYLAANAAFLRLSVPLCLFQADQEVLLVELGYQKRGRFYMAIVCKWSQIDYPNVIIKMEIMMAHCLGQQYYRLAAH